MYHLFFTESIFQFCNKRAFEGLNAADIILYLFNDFPFDMIFYDNIDDRIMYDF